MRTALLLTLLLAALPATAQSGASRKARARAVKVAVLPFQAVSADVPSRAGLRATARLASEIHVTEGLALAEPPPPSTDTPPPPEPLTVAREAMKEATAAREARDFARADAALTRALDAYAAGAARLSDASELADAYALRAAVRYATGRDDEAAASLTHALAVAPGRSVPLASTSPLFAKTVERVRASRQSQPRGGVRFESVPPGLAVTLDGHPLGTAPVRVTEVPPGAHLWRAVLPSGEAVGGVVEVTSDQQAVVKVRPAGTGPDAALALALAGNRLDSAALEAASALGRAAGASLVVLGTVSRTGPGLALDAFVLAPGDTSPRRLPRLSVDADLLESGAPLRGWAATLAAKGVEAGTTESLPAEPAADVDFAALPMQVTYPTSEEHTPAAAPPATTPAPDRKPLAPNRKPLVRP
ncbi:PEGA domain-containing protein [Pyxidicoccus fallax]|uniref:PEGA domain-containing protein n=2 Tax=Pyxidicoccus fallax TaxID=394095 RepID=A0A848LTS5_9BACT|nr:PEGA domain-containing protein [Pyxidicoccus fallax]NMO21355.1 PEGA domain-containing protein [Pyxidicoccus fallax]NPC76815.1 PEGA domain-containing protein [Pyxidicoccus fallax]